MDDKRKIELIHDDKFLEKIDKMTDKQRNEFADKLTKKLQQLQGSKKYKHIF